MLSRREKLDYLSFTMLSYRDADGYIPSAQSAELGRADLDAGAHRRCKNAGTNVLTLSGSGLSLDNSAHECVEVLAELLSTEGSLTDNAVNDVGLIETVLDLTCLSLGNRTTDIGGYGTCLRVRHESLRTEDLTETTDQTHHVGSSDDNVEVEPVFLLDLLCVLLGTNIVSACFLSGIDLVLALAECKNANLLTGTVGENDSASYLLIGVT